MTAHFPRPKTVSLSAWRTHSQHSMPGRASAPRGEPREPPRWRVRGRRQQGWGCRAGDDHTRAQVGCRAQLRTDRGAAEVRVTDPAAAHARKHTHHPSA